MQCLRPRWRIGTRLAILLGLVGASALANSQEAGATASGNAQLARVIGSIKSVQGDSLTLSRDSGGELAVTVSNSTKILRVSPGETDLKNATPLQIQELQAGDRVVVRGPASADGRSMNALSILVMKQSDVSAKQERERADWQRRGVGGLVSAVDRGAGTITIASGGFGASREIVIDVSKDTIVRRYAPESIRFDDATPASVDQIKLGDQLRARGSRNSDSGVVNAEEIVFGSFRNIAGTISAIDAANNLLSVQDAISKKEVVVQVSPDSQLKKLPAQMAQGIAMRLKRGNQPGGDQAGGTGSPQSQQRAEQGEMPRPVPGAANAGAQRGNGQTDLQRFLSRIPNSTLSDLQKGDAVMIVSTTGEGSGPVKGIVLLAGVEPILESNAARKNPMMLSPWSLSAPSGEGESAP